MADPPVMVTVVPRSDDAVRDRAARPGPSLRSRVIVVAAVAGLLAGVGYGLYGVTHKGGVNLSNPRSWLPRQQLDQPVDRILPATVADPALTIAGDPVEVRMPGFSVIADVTGPVVPGEGLPYRASSTTCTWTVSFSHVVGRMPVAVADFDTIDAPGTVFQPYLVPGQKNLPSVLVTGQHLTFRLRAVMPVGEGLMRWAPDGDHIVAKWDYQVEND